MPNAEVELKFPIRDLGWLQSRLPMLGFQLDTPRTFERNTLYDTPDRKLRLTRQILRIRQYGELWTLTHKRLPEGFAEDDSSRYKIRIETETRIGDGPALSAIFQQIGYLPAFRYEKFRTEWSQVYLLNSGSPRQLGDLPEEISFPSRSHLVLDETPIGDFAELEGPPEWIDQTLAALGIDPASCLTESYGRLFTAWKERTGGPAENLTFDEIPALARAGR